MDQNQKNIIALRKMLDKRCLLDRKKEVKND